jgi:putative serine protease PepD
MSRTPVILAVFAAAIAGGAIGAVIVGGGSDTKTETVVTVVRATGSGAASSVPTSLNTSRGITINQIYRADEPGVVDIDVTSETQASGNSFGFFGGGTGQQTEEGEGAGVVYDNGGYIITDEHVIANAVSVKVNFWNGKSYPAKVIGSDASTDVGVIKVDAPASELHPIAFANSDAAQVGDPVVAIGSPFSLPETVTAGIVSQVGRSITAPNGYTITGSIQTDAAINPGNSGGPLLDAAGQVLGLNDQIETNSDQSAGVGFATPGNTDQEIANELIAGKKIKHAYVGVSLSTSNSGGAQIAPGGVEENSPASNAGLEPGDVITAIDGKSVSSTEGFITAIGAYAPGQTVTLTVKRDGVTKKIKVTLGTRPAEAPTN